jgi:hypothetical protein
MASSKNVIPAKAGIHNILKLLDSRFHGSDKLEIIRGSLKFPESEQYFRLCFSRHFYMLNKILTQKQL